METLKNLSNMPKIILVGGGGHCKSVIDVIEQEGKYEIAGIVESDTSSIGNDVLNYKVIATDDELCDLKKNIDYAVVTVGQIKSALVRIKLFNKLKKLGFIMPTIISPYAYVSKYAKIDEGNVVMHGVEINAGAVIGKNNIINSKALIEHDSVIGNNNHISTGVIINGTCNIGDSLFIGSGSVLYNNINIKSDTIVPAGSVLKRNIS